MMDFKGLPLRFSTFLLFLVLLFVFACSTPSWFPIKKGSASKAKTKELVDKEVVIIDKEEYVKVSNPKASQGRNQPKYLYIPVNEYLAKKESFTLPSYQDQKEGSKKESSPNETTLLQESGDRSLAPVKQASSPGLKKKVVLAHFDDRTIQEDERLGDWIAEKLVKEIDRRSPRVLFVDYKMVKDFLEDRNIPLADLETPKVLQLLNEVFGIQALIFGHLAGPYTFVTKTEKAPEGTASAILKIEMRLIETLSGRTLKRLEASNPIIATKVQGSFSEEKARIKAIDVTLAGLITPISREIDGMDWFCRIAKIEGEHVYLNAGKLTGLKEGDIIDVFRSGRLGEQGTLQGKVRVSALFGIDASVGKLIQGKNIEVNDILRLSRHEGS